MSVYAVTWVFSHSPYSGGSRLVHLALADVCNDEYEGRLWLKQADIAHKSNLSVVHVSRILAHMVSDGALELVEQGGGRGRPTVYRMILAEPIPHQDDGVSEPENPSSDALKPIISDTENPSSDEPLLLLTQIELNETQIVSNKNVETFATFWTTYPKRNGKRLYKPQAETQWKKLSPSQHRDAFIGARFYALAVKDGLIIAKDCFRWVRDHNWEDWQEAATPDLHHNKNASSTGANFILQKVKEKYETR